MKKDFVINSIGDAFLALDQIDAAEVSHMIRPRKRVVEGRTYNLNATNDELEEARDFIKNDGKKETELRVVAPNMDAIDHLVDKKDLAGQAILLCNKCHNYRFMDTDKLVRSADDPELFNTDASNDGAVALNTCPTCGAVGSGYTLKGQASAYEAPVEEPEEASAEEAPAEEVAEVEPEAVEETPVEEAPAAEPVAVEAEPSLENDAAPAEEEATFTNDLEEEPAEETEEDDEEFALPEYENVDDQNESLEDEAAEEVVEEAAEEEAPKKKLQLRLRHKTNEALENNIKPCIDEADHYFEDFEIEHDDSVDEFYCKDALREDDNRNHYGEEAWMLNQIISCMNDEGAYFGSWLYTWPDGESKEDCMYDFGTKEDYEDLEDVFVKVYKAYHNGGLYNAPEEVEAAAHDWDALLGLAPIENIKDVHEAVEDDIPEEENEEEEPIVIKDLLDCIIEPENIDEIVVMDGEEELFRGVLDDMPEDMFNREFASFNVGESKLNINIDAEDEESEDIVDDFLGIFDDEETDQIIITEAGSSEALFEGNKEDCLDKFGNAAFVGVEAPEYLEINVNVAEEAEEPEEGEADVPVEESVKNNIKPCSLFEAICKANGLATYRADKIGSTEYWINETLNGECDDFDLKTIYEAFVQGYGSELEYQFKKETGYRESLTETLEPVNEGSEDFNFQELIKFAAKCGLNTIEEITDYAKEHNVDGKDLYILLKGEADKIDLKKSHAVKPEGDKEAAYARAKEVADNSNKDVVYGYATSKNPEKFFEVGPEIYDGNDSAFRKKYSASTIYVAHPGESGFTNEELIDEAKKDDEEIDKVTDSMEKIETVIDLVQDEVEAVDGYTDAINTLEDSKIPNKEEIISKLHHIKGEELEHLDELKEVEALMPGVGELADEPEAVAEPEEEIPTDEPVEELPAIPEEEMPEALNENNGCRSFKTRQELGEAIAECRNNNKPFRIERSKTEGYRYDLITEERVDEVAPLVAAAVTAAASSAASTLVDRVADKFLGEDAPNALEPVEWTGDEDRIEPEEWTGEVEVLPAEEATVPGTTAVTPADMSDEEIEIMTKIGRIANDIADSIKEHYDIDAEPALIVADILQDLKLIGGRVDVRDLEDTPINNATRQMFQDYNDTYEMVDQIMSALTGESIHTTPEQKLAQAIQALDSEAFSRPAIDAGIGSQRFIQAARAGAVPYIAANDIPMLEAYELKGDPELADEADKEYRAEQAAADGELVDFDTEAFDESLNNHLTEAYGGEVLYHTEGGTMNEKGVVVLEGILDGENVSRKVIFTLTPKEALTEGLTSAADVAKAVGNIDFIASNNLSDELFEYTFKPESSGCSCTAAPIKFAEGRTANDIMKEFDKSTNQMPWETRNDKFESAANWEYVNHMDFYVDNGYDVSNIKTNLMTDLDTCLDESLKVRTINEFFWSGMREWLVIGKWAEHNDIDPKDLTREDASTIARDLLENPDCTYIMEEETVDKNYDAYLAFINAGFDFQDRADSMR